MLNSTVSVIIASDLFLICQRFRFHCTFNRYTHDWGCHPT